MQGELTRQTCDITCDMKVVLKMGNDKENVKHGKCCYCGSDIAYIGYHEGWEPSEIDICFVCELWIQLGLVPPPHKRGSEPKNDEKDINPDDYKYPIKIYYREGDDEEEGYYVAYLPDFGFSACSAAGETEEEALKNLKEVKKFVIVTYLKDGDELPKPSQDNVEKEVEQ